MIKRMLACIALVALLLCNPLAVRAKPLDLNEVLEATCRVYVSGIGGKGRSGSGTCVAYQDGKYYVLTNAHVAAETRYARLEFFRNGRKTYPIPATVVWRRLVEKTLVDFAIIVVEEKYFGKYPPRIIPLVPTNYVMKKDQYIYSAGCPRGAWVVAWEGFVSDKKGNEIIFHPPPIGGQSGSGILVNYPSKNGELETRVAAVLTWRIGDEKVIKDSKGFEKAKGGAIAMSSFYNAIMGRTSSPETVPDNYEKIRASTHALGSDGKYYPITYYADGSRDVTVPPGTRIISWDCPPGGVCPPRWNPQPNPWQPSPQPGPQPKPQPRPQPKPTPTNPYDKLPDFTKPKPDVDTKQLKELQDKLAEIKKKLLLNDALIRRLEQEKNTFKDERDKYFREYQDIGNTLDTAKDEVEKYKRIAESKIGEYKKFADGKVNEYKKLAEQKAKKLSGQIKELEAIISEREVVVKDAEKLQKQVVNISWQRNGTLGVLGLGILAAIGLYLFRWRRDSIRRNMDAVEDKAQEHLAKLIGEEPVQRLREMLDAVETKIGDKIEDRLGKLAPEFGDLLGNLEGRLNEKLEGTMNKEEAEGLRNDLLDIITNGLEELPKDGLSGEDLKKHLGQLEGVLIDQLERRLADKVPSQITTIVAGMTEGRREKRTQRRRRKKTQPKQQPEPPKLPPVENDNITEMARQLMLLKQRDGESIKHWAMFASLYREAVKELRYGSLYFDGKTKLQGQAKTADAIDNWVRDKFMERTSKEELLSGDKMYREAMMGFLYQEAIHYLRTGALNVLGAESTANAIEEWVQKEFMRRMGIRIGRGT